MTKGIILAGGSGSRLYPLTAVTNKHLLPVYDKPMIYYPLTTLMLSNIREILIISTPEDLPRFERLLGDGTRWGITLSYASQPTPEGLPDAFIIGESFIGGDSVCLILGDNLFYGHGLPAMVGRAAQSNEGATIFAHYVSDPWRFGVVTLRADGNVEAIVEKPANPKSNYAVAGLYIYPAGVVEIAKTLKPSARGETEITDLNNAYLERGRLTVEVMGRGMAWFDAGTPEALAAASQYVHTIESRQNTRISCPEEVAFRMNYIDGSQLRNLAQPFAKSPYGQYLLDLLDQVRIKDRTAMQSSWPE